MPVGIKADLKLAQKVPQLCLLPASMPARSALPSGSCETAASPTSYRPDLAERDRDQYSFLRTK